MFSIQDHQTKWCPGERVTRQTKISRLKKVRFIDLWHLLKYFCNLLWVCQLLKLVQTIKHVEEIMQKFPHQSLNLKLVICWWWSVVLLIVEELIHMEFVSWFHYRSKSKLGLIRLPKQPQQLHILLVGSQIMQSPPRLWKRIVL